jgi:hypothetical protein
MRIAPLSVLYEAKKSDGKIDAKDLRELMEAAKSRHSHGQEQIVGNEVDVLAEAFRDFNSAGGEKIATRPPVGVPYGPSASVARNSALYEINGDLYLYEQDRGPESPRWFVLADPHPIPWIQAPPERLEGNDPQQWIQAPPGPPPEGPPPGWKPPDLSNDN